MNQSFTRRGTSFFGIAVLFSISLVPSAKGESWTFQGLGDLSGGLFKSATYDVSDDAAATVGSGFTSVDNKAFHWTAGGGMSQIENSAFYSHSSAISAGGTVAVGWTWDTATAQIEAYRWTAQTGAVGIGDLPGGTFESYANDVSADGNAIVGLGNSNSGYEAFRWTQSTGPVGLGDLPGGPNHSAAFGISRDGSVVVGEGNSALGHEAFVWSQAAGMVGLGDLPGGTFDSHAEDVLANGDVIIGYGHSNLGMEAFRWSTGGGMIGLGDLAGGIFQSKAWSGSADGSVIVGEGSTANGQEAFIWDTVHGMRNLRDVLISDYGADLSGWTLTHAFAMSADGKAIGGAGINPDGQQEAWLAHVVPEPSSLVLGFFALGTMGLLMRQRRR